MDPAVAMRSDGTDEPSSPNLVVPVPPGTPHAPGRARSQSCTSAAAGSPLATSQIHARVGAQRRGTKKEVGMIAHRTDAETDNTSQLRRFLVGTIAAASVAGSSGNGDGRGDAVLGSTPGALVELSVLQKWPQWRRTLKAIVQHRRFEVLSTVMVLLNCAFMAASDPTAPADATINVVCDTADLVFVAYFAVELLVKSVALGLREYSFSYLRDPWNRFDCAVIVLSVALALAQLSGVVESSGISSIRAVRLLRPLRALGGSTHTKALVQSVLASIPHLADVIVMYGTFLIVFAIAAVMLWKGKLLNRCAMPGANGTWRILDTETICSNSPLGSGGYTCPFGQRCVKYHNPQLGKVGFDNVGQALLTLFVSGTLSGWTTTMYYTMDGYSGSASIFHVLVVVIGSYYIINLSLVIINYAFLKNVQTEMPATQADLEYQQGFAVDGNVLVATREIADEPAGQPADDGGDAQSPPITSGSAMSPNVDLHGPQVALHDATPVAAAAAAAATAEATADSALPVVLVIGSGRGGGAGRANSTKWTQPAEDHWGGNGLDLGIPMVAVTSTVFEGEADIDVATPIRSRDQLRFPAQPPPPTAALGCDARDQHSLTKAASSLALWETTGRRRSMFGNNRASSSRSLIAGLEGQPEPLSRRSSSRQLATATAPMNEKASGEAGDSEELRDVPRNRPSSFRNPLLAPRAEENVAHADSEAPVEQQPAPAASAMDTPLGNHHASMVVVGAAAAISRAEEQAPRSPPQSAQRIRFPDETQRHGEGNANPSLPTPAAASERHSVAFGELHSVYDASERDDEATQRAVGHDDGDDEDQNNTRGDVDGDGNEDSDDALLAATEPPPLLGLLWRSFRLRLRCALRSQTLAVAMGAAVILNMIALMSDYHGASAVHKELLDVLNIVFVSIFSVELLVKFVGLGPRNFAKDRFNVFDGVVVLLSWVDIVFWANVSTGVSALRAFRLIHVVRLSPRLVVLSAWVDTLLGSIKAASILTVLLTSLIVLYSLLGMQLFGGKTCRRAEGPQGAVVCPRENFDNLGYSFLTLFQLLTAEDWQFIMYNAMDATSDVACIFFISFFVLANYMFLNFFVAVMLANRQEVDADQLKAAGKQVLSPAALADEIEGKKLRRLYTWRRDGVLPPEVLPEGDDNDSLQELEPVVVPPQRRGSDGLCRAETAAPQPVVGGPLPIVVGHGEGRAAATDTNAAKNGRCSTVDCTATQVFYAGACSRNTVFGGRASSEDNNSLHHETSEATMPAPVESAVSPLLSSPGDGAAAAVLLLDVPKTQPRHSKERSGSSGCDDGGDLNHLVSEGVSLGGATVERSDGSFSDAPTVAARGGARWSVASGRGDEEAASAIDCERGDKIAAVCVAAPAVTDDAGAEAPSKPAAETGTPEETDTTLAEVPTPLSRWQRLLLFLDDDASSLFLFRRDNRVVAALRAALDHPYYEGFLTLVIFLSCAQLAADGTLLPPDHPRQVLLSKISLAITIAFTVEAIAKIIADGFVFHRTAYLRDPWNVVDFITVIVSLVADFSATGGNVGALKVLRCVRPLRLINRSDGMRIVVESLISALPSMLYVVFILLTVFLLFGTVGVQFFKGSFYACTSRNYGDLRDAYPTRVRCQAAGGAWVTHPANFDNIGSAVLTLFQMVTFEGWVVVMRNGMDSVSHDHSPVINHRPWMAIYFVVFLTFSAFFVVNFFVAVLMDRYERERTAIEAREAALRKDHRLWIALQNVAIRNCKKMRLVGAVAPWRAAIRRVVLSTAFERVVCVVVTVSAASLATEHNEQPPTWTKAIEYIDYATTAIFVVEGVLKTAALGIRGYLIDRQNVWDLIITLVSVAGVIVNLSTDEDLTVIIYLRILRLGRPLRVLRLFEGVRTLVTTLQLSARSIFNVAGMLFLHLFFFAVIGMALWARVADGDQLGRHANFRDIGTSLLTLLRMVTGEGWDEIRGDCAVSEAPLCNRNIGNCGNPTLSVVYFVSFMLAGMYILVNLFVTVIVGSFDDANAGAGRALTDYHMQLFNAAWIRLDPQMDGFLPSTALEELLTTAQAPLGYAENETRDQRRSFWWALGQRIDERIGADQRGEIHYVDVVPALIHLSYPSIRVDLPPNEQASLERDWADAFPIPDADTMTWRPLSLTMAACCMQRWWRALHARRAHPETFLARRLEAFQKIRTEITNGLFGDDTRKSSMKRHTSVMSHRSSPLRSPVQSRKASAAASFSRKRSSAGALGRSGTLDARTGEAAVSLPSATADPAHPVSPLLAPPPIHVEQAACAPFAGKQGNGET